MTKDFITEFDETTKELLNTISLFSQEQLNVIPFEGSWTAGQVAEHLLKSESGLPRLFNGNSRPTTERQPDEKVEAIQSIFLNFDTKLKAPEFIIPSNEVKEKQALFHALQANRDRIRKLIDTIDLSRTFTDFPFPQLGEFTGWEWICFVVSHSRRHIRQLKNIYTAISNREIALGSNE